MFVRIVHVSLKRDSAFQGVLENLATILTPVKKVVGKNSQISCDVIDSSRGQLNKI